MPITVSEKYDSRRAGPDWREYAYIVTGTDSEDVAMSVAPGSDFLTISNPVVNPDPGGEAYLPMTLVKKTTAEQQVAGPDIEQHTWYVRHHAGTRGHAILPKPEALSYVPARRREPRKHRAGVRRPPRRHEMPRGVCLGRSACSAATDISGDNALWRLTQTRDVVQPLRLSHRTLRLRGLHRSAGS